ncbi:MAG: cyclomaltodextrinase C-terminal domain-containing protein [Bacteroidales bacterium]
MLILLNRSDKAYGLSLEKYQEIIPRSFTAKEVISNNVLLIKNSITIPAKQAIILEIQK